MTVNGQVKSDAIQQDQLHVSLRRRSTVFEYCGEVATSDSSSPLPAKTRLQVRGRRHI